MHALGHALNSESSVIAWVAFRHDDPKLVGKRSHLRHIVVAAFKHQSSRPIRTQFVETDQIRWRSTGVNDDRPPREVGRLTACGHDIGIPAHRRKDEAGHAEMTQTQSDHLVEVAPTALLVEQGRQQFAK